MHLTRTSVKPFSEKQIELATTFADQAVIAIENTRLFEAEQQRTRELTELLEQQTATSEVLQVISSSPGDLEPVFATMLEKAVRICDAKFGNLWLREGDFLRIGATHGAPPAWSEFLRRDPVVRIDPRLGTARAIAAKQPYQVADVAAEPTYGDKVRIATIELAGARSLIGVPLLRDDEVIGFIVIYRQEVRPFTDKQIEVVQNFAAQAVIAIENARLLNELRQRTTDLTERTADLSEALEQQTATTEVLSVISSSPGELEPVFQTMLEKAVRICQATFGNIYRWDGHEVELVASHNVPPAFAEHRRRSPYRPSEDNAFGRMIATKTLVHAIDAAAERAYTERREPGVVAAVELGGVRTYVAVPLLKDGGLIGVLTVYRKEVRPFTDKQIELLSNFAAQAVIAIENTRLLNELRQRTDDLSQRTADLTEALEQQTATSEVLQVISSSPGDLEPVFATMLENAVRICDAKFGNIYRWDGDARHLMASHNTPAAFVEARRYSASRPGPETPSGRMIATKALVHVVDLAAEHSYAVRDPWTVDAVELGGVRTLLVLPMLKENELIGAFTIYRQEVRPFTDKQIELVQNFAAQAVIAIENARLLSELRELLQQQTATADVLKVISRSTFDLQAVLFGKYRAVLAVPLMREGLPIGVLGLTRLEPRSFSDKQIELLTTFADQAVIAIENVRLFESVEARTRELAKSLENLRTTQDRLVQTQELASLGQLTAGIAHEIKNPLNFVNNFSAVSVELIDELREALGRVHSSTGSCAQRSERSPIRCKAISTRSCSTASAPTPSSRTCCCTRAKARANIGWLMQTPSSRRASISPIMVLAQRSKASRLRWNGRLIPLQAKSMSSPRRSHGLSLT